MALGYENKQIIDITTEMGRSLWGGGVFFYVTIICHSILITMDINGGVWFSRLLCLSLPSYLQAETIQFLMIKSSNQTTSPTS